MTVNETSFHFFSSIWFTYKAPKTELVIITSSAFFNFSSLIFDLKLKANRFQYF